MLDALSRRDFLAASIVVGGAAILGSSLGATNAAAGEIDAEGPFTLTFTPGTYTASAKGQHEQVTVEVSFSEHAISSVTVTENQDTPFVSRYAVDLVTSDIMRYQTYDVSACTGSTMTSNAIIAAVQDCFDQAGAQVTELASKPAAKEVSHADEECDIVVIGAGTAGVMAAATASTADGTAGSESGLSVIVVEQLPFVGGNFTVSGAGMATMYGDPLHESGQYETIDEDTYVTYLKRRSNDDYLNCLNEPLQRAQYQAIRPAEVLMMDLGAPYTDKYTSAVWPFEGDDMPKNGWLELGFRDANDNQVPFSDAPVPETTSRGFAGIVDGLPGVDVRTSTRAEELITDEAGAVVGVKVTHTDQANNLTCSYEIHAKKVILATGAPNHDREFLEKHDFDLIDAFPFSLSGSDGSAFRLVESAGREASVIGNGSMCYNGCSPEYGFEGGVGLFLSGYPSFNENSERFCDEGGTMDVDTGRNTCAQPGAHAWYIADSASVVLTSTMGAVPLKDGQIVADYVVEHGWGVRGDSVEEVAQAVGLDPKAVAAAVEKFNKAAAGECEDEMGSDPATMHPVLEPPYYAVEIQAYRTEPYISLQCAPGTTQVVDADGKTIENLYGAGTCIGANIFYHRYFSYDGGLTTAVSLGYLAATEAREAIQG